MLLASLIHIVVGAWLLSVPYLFAHEQVSSASDRVVGLLLIVVGLAALKAPRALLGGVLVGAYLVVMPFLLGYAGTTHQLHDVLLGAGLAVTALVALRGGVTRSATPSGHAR